MKCFADTYHDGLQLLSVPLWLDRKNQKQVLRPETAAGGRFSKPHWPFLWAASFRWAASNSIWSEETEVNTPTFTHTWTLKSPLWNHTYFLEFSQAICGQREDACIETHVSRLTYVHVKWFLTVPSSYILLLLCRTQGCRESWKSEQISQVGLIHLSFLLLSSPDWKAATESETSSSAGSFIVWFRRVLDVPVRRVCHRFLYQQHHHMLQKNRRFWYHCPTVPEAHRRVLIQPVKASLCLPSRWFDCCCHLDWTHTFSHTLPFMNGNVLISWQTFKSRQRY